MTWPRRFLAVPSSLLVVDPAVSMQSPKATPADIRRWMGNVPEIYSMLEQGYRDEDFHRMGESPLNPHERDLSESYRHLWSTSPSAEPIRAEFVDGAGLQVVKGQHRVRAAQAQNIPYMPVQVAAKDAPTLEAISVQLEHDVSRLDPHAVAIHRIYDQHQREVSDQVRLPPTVRPLPEHLELERDRPWSTPDRRR